MIVHRPKRAPRGVQLLLRISETLNAGEGFQAGLLRVMASVAETLEADAVCLVLPQEDAESNYRVSWVTVAGEGGQAEINAELGLRQRVVHGGERLRLDDAEAAAGFRDDLDRKIGVEPRALLAVPLRLRDVVLGGLWAVRRQPLPFSAEDEDLLEAVADQLAVWVRNEQLLDSLRERLAEREMLLQASRRVGESIDLDIVLEGVFDALKPVVQYDAAAVFLTTSDRHLTLAAQRGYDRPEALARIPLGQGIVGRASRLKQGVLISDVRGHADYIEARSGTRSEIAVPILSNGVVIGVVNLESDRTEEYGLRDLRLAELIAAQVGSAIANARLHQSRVRSAQVESELALAREIQLSLLPAGPSPDSRLPIAAVNVPSSAVGGDYYDWLLIDENTALVVIADVSGHGLSAALLTASMRTGFRMLARQTSDPVVVARRLDAQLYESSPPNQFVAAVIARLDLRTGRMQYCNAGHVPPVLVSPDGQTREMVGGGPPLGLLPSVTYERMTTILKPGEILAFYTDGLVEAQNKAGDEYGAEAVTSLLASLRAEPLHKILEGVRASVRAHRGRRGAHLDDVTLMLARWTGPSPS